MVKVQEQPTAQTTCAHLQQVVCSLGHINIQPWVAERENSVLQTPPPLLMVLVLGRGLQNVIPEILEIAGHRTKQS
jgi:hypothetical protein